jgi:hypothetical protein
MSSICPRSLVGPILSMCLISQSTLAVEWNAANDFSATSNPAGAWSYGWFTNPGANFNLYTLRQSWVICLPNQVDRWYKPTIDPEDLNPALAHNAAGTVLNCTNGSAFLQPNDLVFHPGANNEHSVLRWTAPSTGVYSICATFRGRDVDGATTDVHVFHNAIALFNCEVSGTGIPTQFVSSVLQVAVGDTIDFTVGYGSNNDYFNDTTAVDARIAAGGATTCIPCAAPCRGNGICESGENRCTCPSDCGAPVCGDGTCCPGESSCTCPSDCAGTCCGNGTCESGENRCTCPSDCGAPVCGDGTCCPGETCNCPADCGESCGDGACNCDENCCTCPQDCHYQGVCSDGICIPTLSEWGMVAMAALILSAGGVVIARRRAAG